MRVDTKAIRVRAESAYYDGTEDALPLCDRIEALEAAIGNLIAVIDRDGGHAQHGDPVDECKRAEAVVLGRIVRVEALGAALGKLSARVGLDADFDFWWDESGAEGALEGK